MDLVYVAICIFSAAAIMGIVILSFWFSGKRPPWAVLIIHGLAAVTALTLTIIYTVNNPATAPKTSLVLLGLAAIAGIYMAVRERTRNIRPQAIAVIHVTLAVTGLLLLMYFAFSNAI